MSNIQKISSHVASGRTNLKWHKFQFRFISNALQLKSKLKRTNGRGGYQFKEVFSDYGNLFL